MRSKFCNFLYYKNKTGETFRDYTGRLKTDEGKRLLLETNLSVEEIALNLGYSDYRSFIRIFRQQTGKSPTDFRRDRS
ncbi:MAG: helix-turn-helix domain-containing protein [Bullifex sp.]